MTEILDETSAALKRIKQLENQNIKFKRLLEAAVELTNKDAFGLTYLKNESNSLKAKVEELETEKLQLEQELNAVLANDGEEMTQTVRKLEEENAELKTKFESILKQIKGDNLDLSKLKEEDEELKKALAQLENEKATLIEKIRTVGQNFSDTTTENLRRRLFEIESEKCSIMNSLDGQSSSDIMPAARSLDETVKSYIQALEEQASIKEKISELEQKNEELIKIVQKIDSDEMKPKVEVTKEIISSNANFIHEIDKVRSRIEEIDNDFMKTLETPKDFIETRIIKFESAKLKLYKELEEYLLNSSKEISKITENISDPEIKRLVNEIEIQKTVLLYSLQAINQNPYNPNLQSQELNLLENPNPATKSSNDFNLSTSRESEPSGSQSSSHKEKDRAEPSTSSEDHTKLEQEINRLEKQRENLLEQLRSVSATSAQRIDEIITQNERQLQTQSELHSTFMRESSHEIVIAQNYDDATNQLYADEDSRLEQRIRELEIENIRIQRELDTILEEIRADKNEMSRLQFTGQVLKQRIEELEHSTFLNKDKGK